jgi:hypothetical protein
VKEPFQQMTFMLADAQVDLVNKCLSASKKNLEGVETFGNENGNGNGLYRICLEWSQQKIL